MVSAMYYEEYDKKPHRRRKKRRCGGCLGRLLGRLITFALILAISWTLSCQIVRKKEA